MNSAESSLFIKSVRIISPSATDNDWVHFISKYKICTELGYVVYTNSENQLTDERKLQFSIPLLPDLYSKEPVIHLNQMIRNETFTTGINSDIKFYKTLKIKLQSNHPMDDDFTLQFDIEDENIEQ